jgi:hypothetical protein
MHPVRQILLIFNVISALVIISCSDNLIDPVVLENIIYERQGLVDSAVVNGCYPNTKRFFVDTLYLNSYSKVKIEFDGAANSDGSYIKVYSNTSSFSNVENYSVENAVYINAHHNFVFSKPADTTWIEIRIYINPPVCGEGEFKFTRARDLKIYGIK